MGMVWDSMAKGLVDFGGLGPEYITPSVDEREGVVCVGVLRMQGQNRTSFP